MITDTSRIPLYYELSSINGTTCNIDGNGNVISTPQSVEYKSGIQDIVLTAKWEPLELEVIYIVGTSAYSEKYSDSKVLNELYKLKVDDSSNHRYYVWYYDEEFTKPVEARNISELNFEAIYGEGYHNHGEVVTGYLPLTLYGKPADVGCIGDNSFNLSYNSNGGTAYDPEEIDVSSVNQKDEKLPIPTKNGYKFDGWYYDSKLTKKVDGELKFDVLPENTTDENGCPIFKDVTLYAKWVEDASQLPDGDDSFHGAVDPSDDENTGDGLVEDDVPDTGATVNLVILLVFAGMAVGLYLYVLKNDKIKRMF